MAISTFKLNLAARVVDAGGLLAYPTEAVYGLGCDPENEDAVDALNRLKQRPPETGYLLIASEYAQLEPYVAGVDETLYERMAATWPGPVTWVTPAASRTPVWITGGRDTVAVRVTAHPVASALCTTVGHAIVSTSANTHGRPPARTYFAAVREFGSEVDYILSGEVGPCTRPTQIRDLLTDEILRQ